MWYWSGCWCVVWGWFYFSSTHKRLSPSSLGSQDLAFERKASRPNSRNTLYFHFGQLFYMRYIESPGVPFDTAMLANAIEEQKRGIPTVIHQWWSMDHDPCRLSPQPITRPGALLGDQSLIFGIAMYLIAQGPGSLFGLSAYWYDEYFCWQPHFDVDYGIPKGDAVRETPDGRIWNRAYTLCDVRIDMTASQNFHPGTATITLKALPTGEQFYWNKPENGKWSLMTFWHSFFKPSS